VLHGPASPLVVSLPAPVTGLAPSIALDPAAAQIPRGQRNKAGCPPGRKPHSPYDAQCDRGAAGRAIEESGGIAQGMSVSPVFVDGKLLGAISMAAAWAVPQDALALVTPIESMLELLRESFML